MAGIDELKQDALDIFLAGVAAADPHDAVVNALDIHDGEWSEARRIFVIAAGKAAVPMMRAALETLPEGKIAEALAVTNYENVAEIPGVTVIGASHPLPDENGAAGAREAERIAHQAKASDLVLCLISGGASALMPAPVEGVSLDEKIATNDLLLKSGADIVAMNTVRKALSRLKGGGLARAISPAQGLALILSDVPGDDLAIIASGPTVADPAPPARALEIVRDLGLAERLPQSVMAHLQKRASQPAEDFVHTTENMLIGSNRISLSATEKAAHHRGYKVIVLSEWLEGDVQDAAKAFLAAARAASPGQKTAILAGGETSRAGQRLRQGRPQPGNGAALRETLREHSLAKGVGLPLRRHGRTRRPDRRGRRSCHAADARGAAAKGLSAEDYLANNDAYHALRHADALVITGGTGTNVADLQVLLLG
jgi:glycerate 2-kinase